MQPPGRRYRPTAPQARRCRCPLALQRRLLPRALSPPTAAAAAAAPLLAARGCGQGRCGMVSARAKTATASLRHDTPAARLHHATTSKQVHQRWRRRKVSIAHLRILLLALLAAPLVQRVVNLLEHLAHVQREAASGGGRWGAGRW